MNQTQKTMGLVAQLNDEAAKKQAEAMRSAEQRIAAARAFDAAVAALSDEQRAALPQPDHLFAPTMKDGNAWVTFKKLSPEELTALLAEFRPCPRFLCRGRSGTGFYAQPKADATEVTEVDGLRIDASRTGRYPTNLTALWTADLKGVLIDFRAELLEVHGVTPRYEANVRWSRDTDAIVEVTNARVTFPIASAGVTTLRYAAAGRDSFPWIVIHAPLPPGNTGARPLQAAVAEWAAACAERALESRTAYLRIKAEANIPAFVCEPERFATAYANEGKLRAGTLEQYAALHSEAAVADRALAEKHWREYAKDHGLDSERGYFDHYGWACAFLKRVGLYEVQHEGKPYRYGTAWL